MNRLVEAARKYKGVKFQHQGRKAHCLDCAGLGWLAYQDCGVTLHDFRKYGPEPFEDGLVKHVTKALGEPVKLSPVTRRDLEVGDVVIMRFAVNPHHVAMVTDYLYGGLALIHADGHTGRVVEHRLADDHIQRITHVFRRPV